MTSRCIMPCTVATCGWYFVYETGGATDARDEERKHWEAYHEPKKEDEDGDS